MKKLWKYLVRYSDIFILILTGIIAIMMYINNIEKSEIPIAIFGVGISVAFSIRQSRIENDKIFKELFILYNDKYDIKFNEILNEIVCKTKSNANYELSETELPIVTDYLNMCAEEYLWFTKGRIEDAAWRSWERGMLYYLFQPPIKRYVEKEKLHKQSYYGIFEYLKL